ncbi:hypothetical protein HGRIS_004737 [Hohenbuehelia grisea]|uniref:Uncharacterized protein n=1 Tax=Hohenbuehelia grisea TaxID=104357 RepID=A0ABR3JDN9_9AGAR
MHTGTLAVAVVHHQVVIVQAARSHSKSERWLDVHTYTPFGERLFLASDVPKARIASSDILSVLPSNIPCSAEHGMLELPPQAFFQYVELSSRARQRHETLWSRLVVAQ